MTDVVEFIRARLDEDEQAARAAPGPQWNGGDGDLGVVDGQDLVWGNHTEGYIDAEASAHIARHDPARVLREVEAKRALLAEHSPRMVLVMNGDGTGGHLLHCGRCSPSDPNHRQRHPCASLRLLAVPYADHSDYREEWRP